jgi:hypothetical protein
MYISKGSHRLRRPVDCATRGGGSGSTPRTEDSDMNETLTPGQEVQVGLAEVLVNLFNIVLNLFVLTFQFTLTSVFSAFFSLFQTST